MAKHTRSSKILNLCKTNSNFVKTTTSNFRNQKQNETVGKFELFISYNLILL